MPFLENISIDIFFIIQVVSILTILKLCVSIPLRERLKKEKQLKDKQILVNIDFFCFQSLQGVWWMSVPTIFKVFFSPFLEPYLQPTVFCLSKSKILNWQTYCIYHGPLDNLRRNSFFHIWWQELEKPNLAAVCKSYVTCNVPAKQPDPCLHPIYRGAGERIHKHFESYSQSCTSKMDEYIRSKAVQKFS